jgi:hypothetical protein
MARMRADRHAEELRMSVSRHPKNDAPVAILCRMLCNTTRWVFVMLGLSLLGVPTARAQTAPQVRVAVTPTSVAAGEYVTFYADVTLGPTLPLWTPPRPTTRSPSG